MDIVLQPTTFAPIYVQVRDQIESRIKTKHLTVGEKLPSPVQLAKKLSIDAGEVQRAYYELERAGLLVKQKGRDLFGKETVAYLVK